ncbi:MAG: ABC transporter permease [Polyangiaceae bacterium]
MSTAENEVDDKKKTDLDPQELDDAETRPLSTAKKTGKTPVKAAAEEETEESDDAESEDESDDEDDAPPSSKKPRAKAAERKSVPVKSASTVGREPGGSSVKNVITIAKREMRSYFDSLIAYVVIGGSTLGIGIFFFLMQSGGFWEVDRASMARLFAAMPWALAVLVIPLVTMRALAEEKHSGTLELLITMPVRDYEVILGKFSAAFGMCLVLLATTIVYPVAMFVWPWHLGALDWGPVWTGYLGLALFSAAGTALGLLFSGITESQIIAFFLTAGSLLFLQIIGGIVETVPGAVGDAISFVSFETRFAPFARGLIDTRAVIYFLSIAILCLLVAFRQLESRKWK